MQLSIYPGKQSMRCLNLNLDEHQHSGDIKTGLCLSTKQQLCKHPTYIPIPCPALRPQDTVTPTKCNSRSGRCGGDGFLWSCGDNHLLFYHCFSPILSISFPWNWTLAGSIRASMQRLFPSWISFLWSGLTRLVKSLMGISLDFKLFCPLCWRN